MKRTGAAFAVLIAVLAVLCVLYIFIGSVDINGADILKIISGRAPAGTPSEIILNIRAPRLISAAVLGGCLAVSGFLLQVFFGNPIAGPFVLGVSSGAKLVVALVMIWSLKAGIMLSSWAMVAAAFTGSVICMGIVLLIAGRVSKMPVLIICGVMIGYICSAVTDIAVTFADDSNIVNLHEWSRGSFSGTGWENVAVAVPVAVVALIAAFLLSKPMEAYQSGESYALNLGVNIIRLRVWMILLSSILAAVVTAFAGPVSFLGVAVPHIVRKCFNTKKPVIMIPACFAAGAAFCVLCDLIARTLFAPTELSISTVTAVLGAPIVIHVMIGRRKGQGA